MRPAVIPYGRQSIEEDDIRAVVKVLRSPFLTTGPKVAEFEEAFARRIGARHAVSVSSGTAGLHAAVAAAGIGPGDEVLVPALSFLATANAVLYAGAKPVFVDSVPDGFNMDPRDAARKASGRTKAVIPVHFAGEPVDLDALRKAMGGRRITVIEDAAHALGAERKGAPVGSSSSMAVFSFHPVKHITTAEGGMVTTPDPALAKKLRRFRHHGIDVDVVQRDARKRWYYDMVSLGFNYRLTDLQCALGLSQLKKLERFLKRREEIAGAYDEAFSAIPYFDLPPRGGSEERHAWHLYVLRLRSNDGGRRRDKMFQALRARGIGAHVHYRPIHTHSFYRGAGLGKARCPSLEGTFPRMLTIPLFPAMTDGMVRRVIEAVTETAQKVFQERG